jgi:DNA replication and repair protein RecF
LSSFHITHLAIRELRILRSLDLEPSPTLNLISGSNGQGKTTLLEAIYLLATSRSFRTHRVREAIARGAQAFSVRATLSRAQQDYEQFIAVSASERVLKLDDNKPSSTAEYATRSPVVVFHPAEVALTGGPASLRRTLLDRVALFMSPSDHVHAAAYLRAMKARQKLLATEGVGSAALGTYEALMARHGARLTKVRASAAQALIEATAKALLQLGPDTLGFEACYQPGGSLDAAEALEKLEARRARDARRPSAGHGPHLDELELRIGGQPARVVASQGQHRLLTLGIKIGETVCVEQATGTRAVLLLDDVSSELDAARTDALFSFLAGSRNQVFVTTTRPEMVTRLQAGVAGTRWFEVQAGRLAAAP